MKKLLYILVLINFNFFFVNAQSMLTVRDVFDFNINDEFQYRLTYNSNPPNVYRNKVIGKYFSANNDTVFYVWYYNNYYTTFVPSPPHLDYTFSVGTDTSFVTNLDSLIDYYYSNLFVDSCNPSNDSLYYSSQFCGILVYQHYNCVACCFEGESYENIYGKGLGWIWYDDYNPAEYIHYNRDMFYYKKDTLVCGLPDNLLEVSKNTEINETIFLYPNPATNTLTIANVRNTTTVYLYDIVGKVVFEKVINCNTTIDTSYLTQGVYTLATENKENISFNKVIIAK